MKSQIKWHFPFSANSLTNPMVFFLNNSPVVFSRTSFSTKTFNFHPSTNHSIGSTHTRRGMKNAAEQAVKLLANTSGSYWGGSKNLVQIIQNTREENRHNLQQALQGLSTVLQKQTQGNSNLRNLGYSALKSVETAVEKGYLVHLGDPTLYVDLMKACDLTPEIEKTAKLLLDP